MLRKHLALFFNSINIIMNCMYATASLTSQHLPTICSTFSSRLITSNFSSIMIVFCQFFTWIALGDVDLHLPLILVTKANAVAEKTKWGA